MTLLEKLKAERYKGPRSTLKLRELRTKVMVETANVGGPVTHSVTLHFFKDCWLGYHRKSSGCDYPRAYSVYSRDFGKTWKEYKDQFEPAEGYHRAVEYDPSDSSFPTKEW